MKHIARLLFIVLLVAPLRVEHAAAQAGVFTRMGFGARGVAMGNALAADVFGDGSPYYNPALAPLVQEQSLEATAGLLTLDRQLQFLQFVAPLRPRAGIAAGLIHGAVNGIDGRDDSGYHTRDYSTDEMAVFLAFGTRLGTRLTGGFALKLYRSSLIEGLDPARTIGLDLGLTLRASEALAFAITASDLLAKYAWDTSNLYGDQGRSTTDPFPRRFRFGAGYSFQGGKARILAEYEARVSTAAALTPQTDVILGEPVETVDRRRVQVFDGLLRLGGEYRLVEAFALRVGIDEIGSGPPQPSAGFMVQQNVGNLLLRAEYAFKLEPYDTQPMHFVALRLYL